MVFAFANEDVCEHLQKYVDVKHQQLLMTNNDEVVSIMFINDDNPQSRGGRAKFDILPHLDKLTPDGGSETATEKSFLCPVCGSNNFKVDMKTGKYRSWGCSCMDTAAGKRKVRDAINPPWQKPARPQNRRNFTYTDTSGAQSVRVKRVDDGKGNRKFFQEHRRNNTWDKGVPPETRSSLRLYRIDDPVNQAAQGKEILVVEGEGVVDTLLALGIPATTSIGGAGKWKKYGHANYLNDLKDYKVVLCPDRDAPGVKHCEDVEKDLLDHEIEVVGWLYADPASFSWGPQLPESGGYDLGDWIADGATPEEIFAAIEPKRTYPTGDIRPGSGLPFDEIKRRIEVWLETEDPVEKWQMWQDLKRDSGETHRDLNSLVRAMAIKVGDGGAVILTAREFGDLFLGTEEWLLEDLIPAYRTVVVAADAKMGKSLLIYDLVYIIATGQHWGIFSCPRPRRVLIVQTDESQIECQERLTIRGITDLDNVFVLTKFSPELMPWLKRKVLEWGIEVIVFDSLTSIQRHSGYSPKDPEYGYWLYELKDFATDNRITPIVVCHTNKAHIDLGLDKVAGSYSITAAVSEIFMLTRPAEPSNNCDRVLVRVGSRSAEQRAWLIQLNAEDNSWTYQFPCTHDGRPLEDDNSFAPDEKQNCRENIIQFLAHHQGHYYRISELAKALKQSPNTLRKLCPELFKDGRIARKKDGNAYIYGCNLPNAPHSLPPQENSSSKSSLNGSLTPERLINTASQADQSSDPHTSNGSVPSGLKDTSDPPTDMDSSK